MNTRTLLRVGGINLIAGLLIVSPFLPGPSFMSGPTNFLYNGAQLLCLPALLVSIFGLVWTVKEVAKVIKDRSQQLSSLPLISLTLPIFSLLTVFWFSDSIRTYSREKAIERATPLIAAVERFYSDKGYYPLSVAQLVKESYLKFAPSPWIMGIPEYSYRGNGSNFTVSFSQNVIMGFNFEIVIYDKNDKHRAEGELETLYVTNQKHWKYYIYD